nr:MAG TPA: protein of unknown function (DUF5429) [Caudoviricetes sp.]
MTQKRSNAILRRASVRGVCVCLSHPGGAI